MYSIPRRAGLLAACLFASILALAPTALRAEMRTWTDDTGRFSIEAEFIEVLEGKVRLKKADGQIISLPLAKLSTDDQAFLRELMRDRREGEDDPDNPFNGGDDGGGRRGGDFETESGFKKGDRVEVRDGFDWLEGEIVGYDPEWEHVYVTLDNGRTVEAIDHEFHIRPVGSGDDDDFPRGPRGPRGFPGRGDDDAPPRGAGPTQDVGRADTSKMRRIVALGGGGGAFAPDPAVAPVGWAPKPVGLNPKQGFFENAVGLSLAASGVGAIGYSGGAEIGDESSRIELCDLKTGQVIGVLPGPDQLKLLALSPSGKRIATVSEIETFTLGPLQLWDVDGAALKPLASWHASSDEDRGQLEWLGWVDDERLMTLDENGLTMWSLSGSGASGVYHLPGTRMKQPAFSPGGKQFAIMTEAGLAIHNVETGEMITRIAMESFGHDGHVAFSPSGKFVAVGNSGVVEVFEVASGRRLVRAFAPHLSGFAQGLVWVTEAYVLAGGADLVHLPSQMTVWTYNHDAEHIQPLGGRTWYLLGGRGNDRLALLPYDLPHAAVTPVAPGDLVLKPGDEVALRLELSFDMSDPTGRQISPQEQLTRSLTEAGYKVVPDSPKQLVARTSPGETKEIEYSMFGAFGQTQKASVTERVYELELVVDGQIVWSRRYVQGAPMHIQLQENETVDAAITRMMQSQGGYLGGAIPSRVLPAALAERRQSQLTINGLQ
jgi:hypothetical protein